MKRTLKRIQARRLRREQRLLEWWEQERANGKARFVRRSALTYGLVVAGVIDVFERLFYGESEFLLLRLIFFVLTGIVMGSCTWSSMEAKREDVLRKARAKPLPDSQALPQSFQGASKA